MAVTIEKLIEETIAKTKETKDGVDNAKLKEILTKVAVEEMSLKDALGFNDNFIATVYATAFNHYQSGKFSTSLDIFQVLRTLDPKDPRYSLGIGACFQKLKQYEDAIPFYVAAAILEPTSPLPYYYASDCFLKTGNKYGALAMLKMVVPNLSEDAVLKGRVGASMEALQVQIAEDKKNEDRKIAKK